MSVAKVIELSARSSESFEQVIQAAIDKAGETVNNIEGAWVKEQNVVVENGAITGYKVNLKITFVVD
ncbi:MAG TPA: dodecin family protein [Acidimicrobiia bacterium]|nr:dodecin family protein [Acidimicrobiia bacterium]